jgi:hypothetical protein
MNEYSRFRRRSRPISAPKGGERPNASEAVHSGGIFSLPPGAATNLHMETGARVPKTKDDFVRGRTIPEQNPIRPDRDFAPVLCFAAQFIGKPLHTFPIAL